MQKKLPEVNRRKVMIVEYFLARTYCRRVLLSRRKPLPLTPPRKPVTTSAREPDTIFIVRMSYVELYNNQFRNLLENGTHHAEDRGSSGAVGFGSSSAGGRGGWTGADSAGEVQ